MVHAIPTNYCVAIEHVTFRWLIDMTLLDYLSFEARRALYI